MSITYTCSVNMHFVAIRIHSAGSVVDIPHLIAGNYSRCKVAGMDVTNFISL